jgi:deoxyribonuclease V
MSITATKERFRGWSATDAEFSATAPFAEVAEYEPGSFYRRELPCLLGVLALGPKADIVIIDGYVWLANNEPGLGAHLHREYGGIVIGAAKTKFASATDAVAICRGTSRAPLFISAVGMTPAEAATKVIEMDGQYRIPTLLKQVDTLARSTSLATTGAPAVTTP